jgi:hypothetical protein
MRKRCPLHPQKRTFGYCQKVTRYLRERELPPAGVFTFGPVPVVGCLSMARVGAALTQPFVLLHPVFVPPPQPAELVHEVLSRLRTAARRSSGLCAGSSAPSTSTLPAESITTSEDRARAVRAATADVAAPTASAAFPNNPRRLTP